MTTESLYVNSYTGDLQNWDERNAPSPYLADESTGYVHEVKSSGATEGYFGFADPSGSGTINSVTLFIECYGEDTNDLIYIYVDCLDGSGWVNEGTINIDQLTYGWETLNLSTRLDSWSNIQNTQIYLYYQGVGGGDDIYVRRAYLYVDYSATGTPILISDGLSLSDNIGKERHFTISDGLGISDGFPITDRTLSIFDISNLVDVILKQRSLTPLVDSISLTDIILKQRSIQLQDAISIGDSITRDKTTLIIADALNLSDYIAFLRGLQVSDALGITDDVDVNYGATQIQVSDILGLSDDIIKERIFTIQDFVALVDSPLKERVLTSIMDVIGLVDAQFTSKPTLVVLDAISLVDDVLGDKPLSVKDYVSLTESIIRQVQGKTKKMKLSHKSWKRKSKF